MNDLSRERLAILRELEILDTAPEQEFDAVTDMVSMAFNVPISLVSLLDEHRQWFKSSQGLDVKETDIEWSMCAHAAADNRLLFLHDATKDHRFEANPLVVGPLGIRFYAGAPIVVDGVALGAVCALDRQPRNLSSKERKALEAAARIVEQLLTSRLEKNRARAAERAAVGVALSICDWTWELNSDGVLVDIQGGFELNNELKSEFKKAWLGKTLESALGDERDYHKNSWIYIKSCIAQGKSFRQIPVGFRHGASTKTISLTGVPVLDEEGGLTGYRGGASNVGQLLRFMERASQAERVLHQAIDSLDLAFMMTNHDGEIIVANAAWKKVNEKCYRPGMKWLDVVRNIAESGECVNAIDDVQSFVEWRIEQPYLNEPPREILRAGRNWLVHAQPLDEGGAIYVSMDITENKKAEAKLRRSLEMYKFISDVIPSGLVVLDAQLKVTFANGKAEKLWRMSRQELLRYSLNNDVMRRLRTDGRPLPINEHPARIALNTRSPVLGARYALDRDGQAPQWFEVDVHPLSNGTEVLMLFQDVTEQVAKEVIADASAALEYSSSDGFGDGIWDWNIKSKRVYYSRGWKEMLGYHEHEIGESEDEWISKLNPSEAERVLLDFRAKIDSVDTRYFLDHKIRCKDGSYKQVRARGKIFRDAQGRATRVVCVQTDVTDRRSAEEAWASSAEKSKFLLKLSGALRTPLNAITGFSAVSIRDFPRGDNEGLMANLKSIKKAGDELASVVQKIVEFQQLESGEKDFHYSCVSVESLFCSVVEEFSGSLSNKSLHYSLPPEFKNIAVEVDCSKIASILTQLVDNGLKYGDGDVGLSVAEADEHQITICVSNSGPGIDKEKLKKLFVMFERLGYESSSVGGAGLSLALGKQIAEKMGCSLSLKSTGPEGTTFQLIVPRAMMSASKLSLYLDGGDESVPTPLNYFPDTDLSSVLYVEDNPINAAVMVALFKGLLQYDLVVVDSGEAALASLKNRKPNILILDRHLPDCTGETLLATIRNRYPVMRGVPAILFTADVSPGDEAAAFDAGFSQYWSKPLDSRMMKKQLSLLTSKE